MTPPRLSALVPHWHDEDGLGELVSAWPRDPAFELLVVDNGSSGAMPTVPPPGRLITPGDNLGFAGAVDLAAGVAGAEALLVLNPDTRPEAGALEALLEGLEALPDAAGLAPRLVGDDGSPQWRWQVKPLPRAFDLAVHCALVDVRRAPSREPEPGSTVPQPAAAALCLRRTALEAIGGFDPGFWPAWFEDVDLAVRLGARNLTIHYEPEAVFRHRRGSTVPSLGYGRFLSCYATNLVRFLRKHRGSGVAGAARIAIPLALMARLPLALLRRPRRAPSRAVALRGLVAAASTVARGAGPRRELR